ncbi:MAG: hypothetical protein NVSMB3_10680 [Acidobacteriaceae bacterium]
MSMLGDYLSQSSQVLTVKEVATLLRISEGSVRNLVSRSGIPYFRAGRIIRFDPVVLANWFEKKTLVGTKSRKKYWLTDG